MLFLARYGILVVENWTNINGDTDTQIGDVST